MFKILLISIITFILVIIIFLLFISFLNNDINTNQKKIENFFGVEPTFTNCVKYVLPDGTCFRFNSNGTFTINNNITCDIFMIGGGGGAGYNHGSGGGAGAYYYGTNITLNSGTYNIYIGSGGSGGGDLDNAPRNGGDTYITYNGTSDLKINGLNARCRGGGAGGHWNSPTGLAGGCGGGADGWNNIPNTNTVYSGGGTNNDGTVGKGFAGGSARQYYNSGQLAAGGGGGIGSAGENAVGVSGGRGGSGLVIYITGIELVFGGGGGGGDWPRFANSTRLGIGGGATLTNGTFVKVGGDAVRAWEGQSGGDGVINTGSGGGGGKGGRGGNGGSGVVIIKINNDNNTYINENYSNIKNPWGIYFAKKWTPDILMENSGNTTKNAITSGTITKTIGKGYGASVDIDYITGNTQSKIIWPNGSIPSNFTILSLTRYTGGSRGRILQSSYGNWLHGHWGGIRGVIYYEGWKANTNNNIGINNSWLCCISKNGGSKPNNILFDGIPSGTNTGGSSGGSFKLCINDQYENSDWALNCVIIWDKHLTDEEMYLLNYYTYIYMNTGNFDEFEARFVSTGSIQNENIRNTNNVSDDTDIFKFYNTLYIYTRLYINDIIDTNVNTSERSNTNNTNILTFYYNTYNNGELAKNKTADFIIFKFTNFFILRKLIFKAKQTGTNAINAPASWNVYALNNTQYQLIGSGSATIFDYISETKSKSKNTYIHFLVESTQIQAKEYKIEFKSIFGGNQLDFDNIELWRGEEHSSIEATGASNFSLE